MIFGIFRISGHSMMPALNPRDRIIVSSTPYFFSKPKIGDVVVFRYNDKMLIKRIIRVSKGKFFVAGDNKEDNLKTEPIRREEVIGKVIFVLTY